MKIGTAVFTYNRSHHTKQVLDALRMNTTLPEKLYIFHDGLKTENDRNEWELVKKLIKDVDWCLVEIIESEKNKGLADSIIDGTNYVLEQCDAIVVLEDDCIAHPLFMEYMTQSLYKYQSCPEIFCINGYGWAVDVEENGTDAYFCGRAGSWGWATWKNRWAEYERDYTLIGKIKKDAGKFERLQLWGKDLESYVLGNVQGNCNSWTTFWALKIIEKGGICLTPYESLINNIGFDGTGVHCGKCDYKQRLRAIDDLEPIKLPDKIQFPPNYQEAYDGWFDWISSEQKLLCYNNILMQWVRMLADGKSILNYLDKKKIDKVVIWGRGILFELLYEQLMDIEIVAIIESNITDSSYKGIPIVPIDKLPQEAKLIIVIPVYDMKKIQKQIKTNIDVMGIDELIEYKYEGEK